MYISFEPHKHSKYGLKILKLLKFRLLNSLKTNVATITKL